MSVLYNKYVLEVNASEIIDFDTLSQLQNHYIFKEHLDRNAKIRENLLKIRKKIMYRLRRANYRLTNIMVYWEDSYLKIVLWRDFVTKCMDSGMTSGDISLMTNHPLKEVNMYARYYLQNR